MSIIDRFFETIFARIKQLPKEEKKDERNIGGDDIAKTMERRKSSESWTREERRHYVTVAENGSHVYDWQ